MKLFIFVLIVIASLVKAETHKLRALNGHDEKEASVEVTTPGYGLGPRFLESDVTFNRDYNEEGQPPAGRAIQVSIEYPVEEPDDVDHDALHSPAEDEHDEDGNRKLYYNCYYYCWWHWYYGWITYCCPWWGCGYYYC